MDKEITFSNELFFSLLLPPIVFSVGYAVKKPEFFQNFLMIVFMGIISTIISIMLLSLLLLWINGTLIASLSQRDIILIATLLSSNDPISALPILNVN